MRAPFRAAAFLAALTALGCSSVLEVPVETPLQSKLDVSAFRRILIAGFVTDLEDSDVDLSAETSRLLQNQLRSNTRLQVLEPDRPPLQEALEKALEKIGEGGSYNKEEKEQFRLEADQPAPGPGVLAQDGRGVPAASDRRRQARLREPEPLRLPARRARGAPRRRPARPRPRATATWSGRASP